MVSLSCFQQDGLVTLVACLDGVKIISRVTLTENIVLLTEQTFRWYYEGVGGWWEYDERTCVEIEKYHQNHHDNVPDAFELLIAGFIYVIDLENRVQYRRGYPARRRRIKRDLAGIPDCKVGDLLLV